MNKQTTVALVGNPNCGKTTLFNILTGSHQKVGNWSGVTVAKKTGQLSYKGREINVVDLPGIYSLSVADSASSIDERIACEYLLSGEADLIINIIDAANLKRHLFLTLQLLEMGVPCVLAVNMLDIAEKQNISIDCVALANLLGCSVIPLVSTQGIGIEEIKMILQKPVRRASPKIKLDFPAAIENAIEELQSSIARSERMPLKPQYYRWLAIRLLEKDALAGKWLAESELPALADQQIKKIEAQLEEDSDILLADCRYAKVTELVETCVNTRRQIPHLLTERLDAIILHPWLGIPVFLLIMYLMFEISMSIGGLLQPLFDQTSNALLVEGLQYVGQAIHAPVWLTAILAQGVGLGINTILSFTPQIGLLFLILSFLEDSGYMARAAFVMDRFMQVVGLPGKSFIPLIVGFGCNVPAIMATRTLDSHRDRLLTTMMTPFMSCGARLAIFVVFGGAFFPHHAGLLIFLLYLFGIIIAMLTGLLLKTTLLKGEAAPFILEMPHYHVPTWRNLWLLTWQRLKGFVVRAGKVIVPVCVLVGSLNSIKWDGHFNSDGHPQSILAVTSQLVTPVFAPMGIQPDNWPATVGLLSGVLAKEVVIGTLNTLYSQNASIKSSDQSFNLWAELKLAVTDTIAGFKGLFSAQVLNPFTATMAGQDMGAVALGQLTIAFGGSAAALSYLLFVLLYVPCVSTIAVIAREMSSRWAIFSLVWSISIAYSAAVFAYQLLTWRAHPQISLAWVLGILFWQLIWWLILKMKSEKTATIFRGDRLIKPAS